MSGNKLGKTSKTTKKNSGQEQRYPRPSWISRDSLEEEDLCPDCFKVVGDRSRYNLVCMLGKTANGMTVSELTEKTNLRQPTVTHHLQTLLSVDAVEVEPRGRERIYKLNRDAHCFEECHIPY